jgi:Sigma-54 interaction domain
MRRLSIAHLRPLLARLLGDEHTSAAMRHECQRLHVAINTNSLTLMTESLVRLESLADTEGIELFPVGAVTMPEVSLDDWRVVLTSQSNVLIEGREAATEEVLLALTPHCRQPVGRWGDTFGEQHPPTVIVRDVAALTAPVQQRLLRWLDMGERSQVLSTTAQPLFSLVECGQFLADLFYRLNVLRLDVQEDLPRHDR